MDKTYIHVSIKIEIQGVLLHEYREVEKMNKHTPSRLGLYCGYGLLADSLFVLCMLIIGNLDGTFKKMPESQSIQVMLMILSGGLLMLFMGYYYIVRNLSLQKGNLST